MSPRELHMFLFAVPQKDLLTIREDTITAFIRIFSIRADDGTTQVEPPSFREYHNEVWTVRWRTCPPHCFPTSMTDTNRLTGRVLLEVPPAAFDGAERSPFFLACDVEVLWH